MKAQLEAFASGQRRNDISQQMRNIARAMTPREIDQASAHYASQPPEIEGHKLDHSQRKPALRRVSRVRESSKIAATR